MLVPHLKREGGRYVSLCSVFCLPFFLFFSFISFRRRKRRVIVRVIVFREEKEKKLDKRSRTAPERNESRAPRYFSRSYGKEKAEETILVAVKLEPEGPSKFDGPFCGPSPSLFFIIIFFCFFLYINIYADYDFDFDFLYLILLVFFVHNSPLVIFLALRPLFRFF